MAVSQGFEPWPEVSKTPMLSITPRDQIIIYYFNDYLESYMLYYDYWVIISMFIDRWKNYKNKMEEDLHTLDQLTKYFKYQ